MKGIVWGRFYVHAAKKLEEVINDYLKAGIKVVKRANSKGVSHVRFSNDDYWEALGMTESARGRCVNISYIENTIPDDFVKTIILPCTKALPYTAISRYAHVPTKDQEKEDEEDDV